MPPDFHDAFSAYAEFLEKCGCPPRIIWVTPKDVLFTRSPRVYVRLAAHGRLAEARKEYESVLVTKLGVEFRMLCELNGASVCFVWSPRDQKEATQMMMPQDGGLKMSALSAGSIRRAERIRNGLVWEFLRRRHGKNGNLYGYPFGEASGFVGRVVS